MASWAIPRESAALTISNNPSRWCVIGSWQKVHMEVMAKAALELITCVFKPIIMKSRTLSGGKVAIERING